MNYTKPYECKQLLDVFVDNDLIQRDPNNSDNVLVYRAGNSLNEEGWYSENIFEVAQDLLNDIDGQYFLRKELADRGIEIEFEGVTEFLLFSFEERNAEYDDDDYDR